MLGWRVYPIFSDLSGSRKQDRRSWMESDRLAGFWVGGSTPVAASEPFSCSVTVNVWAERSGDSAGELLPLCAILILLLFSFCALLKIFTSERHQRRPGVAAQWRRSSQIWLLFCRVLDVQL